MAAGLYALHWLPLGYGATTYPRTVAVTCLLGAALLACEEQVRPWPLLGAGSLVAVAFACRYSEVVFLLPVALLAVAARSPDVRACEPLSWLWWGLAPAPSSRWASPTG